jgi:hypothetical protein
MFSNFVFGQLNNRIDKSQRNSLLSSPFNTAKRMTKNLDVQKKVRLNYIDILDSLIRIKPADTILICENYDDICFDCPAEYVRILCDTILIELKRGSNGIYYEKNNKLLSESFIDTEANFYGDFQILNNLKFKYFRKPLFSMPSVQFNNYSSHFNFKVYFNWNLTLCFALWTMLLTPPNPRNRLYSFQHFLWVDNHTA